MQQDPDFYNQGGAPSGFSPNAVPSQNGQPADGTFAPPYGTVQPGTFVPQGQPFDYTQQMPPVMPGYGDFSQQPQQMPPFQHPGAFVPQGGVYGQPGQDFGQQPVMQQPDLSQPMQGGAFVPPNMPPQMPPIQPNPYNQPGKKLKKPKKPRKPGGGKRVLALLLGAAIIGGGVYAYSRFGSGQRTATATVKASSIGTTYTGDALIVRNETAFDDEGVQSIEYVAQEGSVVYSGDILCYVYSTGYSTAEMTALQNDRDAINDYQQSLLASETDFDQRMERLENEVLERGLEVRSLVHGARGNLTNQEQILATAITQRQDYFRTKYSTDMRLNRLYDDEATQEKRIESWIKPKRAMQQSIVSFYTDGFEYALTPSAYESYTPSQVRSMINGVKPDRGTAARGRTDLYRLVKEGNYAVLMLVKNDTWSPRDGDTYKLVLEQFSSTVVDAQVLSSTRSGGELLVRLAVLGDVSDVLYMRTCRAQLGEYVDCMEVPSRALYTQNDAVGVVIVTESEPLFVPVTVLREEGGKAYVTSIRTGYLTDGMTVRLF